MVQVRHVEILAFYGASAGIPCTFKHVFFERKGPTHLGMLGD
jgi:hypothetical protein